MHDKNLRSELAVKCDEWLESDEGKKCRSVKGFGIIKHADENFLRNRLEAAFLAGAIAGEEITDRS